MKFSDSLIRPLPAYHHAKMRNVFLCAALYLCFGGLSGACSFQEYDPQVIDADKTARYLLERRLKPLDSGQFSGERDDTFSASGAVIQDLASLLRAAILLRPDIAEARSRIAIFAADLKTAGQTPNPTLALEPEYHSETSENSSSLWSGGILFAMPLSLPSKREARLAEARARLEAARLEARDAVWQLYSGLRASLVNLYAAHRRMLLAKEQVAFHESYLELLERRLQFGEASRFEISTARLALNSARLTLKQKEGMIKLRRAELAAQVGVEGHGMMDRDIDFSVLEDSFRVPLPKYLRHTGLQNRFDIRRSLAFHAASEARLRLEIAEQYPDLTVSPGVFWDQGDVIWRLGTALAAPFFNRNEGPIAKARAVRQNAIDRFMSLQSRVLADLDIARVAHETALATWETARSQTDDKQGQIAQLRLDSDLDSDLDPDNDGLDTFILATARRELFHLQEALLEAELAAIQDFGQLENAVQSPLNNEALADWLQNVMAETGNQEIPQTVTGHSHLESSHSHTSSP